MPDFSDFIVYADESGDHGLVNIDEQHPVFVLAFAIFNKLEYSDRIVPSVQKLKFKYWGHDNIVLHSYDIRKSKGAFSFLMNAEMRQDFLREIDEVVGDAPFSVIAAVIDKIALRKKYSHPTNPYHLAVQFCMKRLRSFLEENDQSGRLTHVVFERRGKREDQALELEFRRQNDLAQSGCQEPGLEIEFADKRHNSSGLQFADLVAYPIARHSIRPEQSNRAYDIIQQKIRRSKNGEMDSYGLKQFP